MRWKVSSTTSSFVACTYLPPGYMYVQTVHYTKWMRDTYTCTHTQRVREREREGKEVRARGWPFWGCCRRLSKWESEGGRPNPRPPSRSFGPFISLQRMMALFCDQTQSSSSSNASRPDRSWAGLGWASFFTYQDDIARMEEEEEEAGAAKIYF